MVFMGEEWGASTPWMFFTDHTDPAIADAVRRGRREEFAGHGWSASDVPDPQASETFERSRLDWDEPGREPHARLVAWYGDLIRLRRKRSDLRDPRLDLVRVDDDAEAQTVVVHRGDHLVVVNLASEPRVVRPAIGTDELRVVLAWDLRDAVADGELVLSGQSAAVLERVAPRS
jgi:maltooligosyltrehalose trehalohydrolase